MHASVSFVCVCGVCGLCVCVSLRMSVHVMDLLLYILRDDGANHILGGGSFQTQVLCMCQGSAAACKPWSSPLGPSCKFCDVCMFRM